MEIEESKTIEERQIKRLIFPKPSKESKKLIINRFEYSFKDYLSKKHALSYRCINRNVCTAYIHVPLSNYDKYLKFLNLLKLMESHIIMNTVEIAPNLIKIK